MSAKTLSELCDVYSLARSTRLAAAKQVEALEGIEKAAKEALLAKMTEMKLSSAGGQFDKYEIKRSFEPNIKNWNATVAWAHETGNNQIFYRRVNEASVKELRENGVEVPGVDWVPVDKLSRSKVKG
jgi:hypothetical protein